MPKAVEAGWSSIDWGQTQAKVTKLQTKIYLSSRENNKSEVVKYQKMLINSFSARLLAAKRVTEDNKCRLSLLERRSLAETLKLDGTAAPLRWVDMRQPDGSLRSMGISTTEERAKQLLALLALEPEWSALFEPNSYGFRPGRSGHDAIAAIELSVRRETKFVLKADIQGCFDRMDRNYLLRKLATFPQMESQIRAWLKSGILKGQVFPDPETVLPSGGAIAPLLVNVALHGLETDISTRFPLVKTRQGAANGKAIEISISEARSIRYADKLVILHAKSETIAQCKVEVENWLREVGLHLDPNNTRICHTMAEVDGEPPGFDFLGFNIRSFPASKYKSGKKQNGESLEMVTKVRPSEKSQREFLDQIKDILEKGHDKAPSLMIKRLNWKIRSWANYFKSGSHSWETFAKLENVLKQIYLNWGKKRFAKRGIGYISRKIFHRGPHSKRTFGWKEGNKVSLVTTLYEFKYSRHVKVKGTRTPYNGDRLDWMKRRTQHPLASKDL